MFTETRPRPYQAPRQLPSSQPAEKKAAFLMLAKPDRGMRSHWKQIGLVADKVIRQARKQHRSAYHAIPWSYGNPYNAVR